MATKPPAEPKSKADMDPNFEKRFRDLKLHALDQHAQGKSGGQIRQFRPDGWNGDPFDVEGLSEPFKRDKANDDLVAAISNGDAPGTTGDVVACSVMINQLSVMERAFRVRHTMRRCRAQAHQLGRQRGHGDDKGPFVQLGIEYVRSLLKQAKKAL